MQHQARQALLPHDTKMCAPVAAKQGSVSHLQLLMFNSEWLVLRITPTIGKPYIRSMVQLLTQQVPLPLLSPKAVPLSCALIRYRLQPLLHLQRLLLGLLLVPAQPPSLCKASVIVEVG